MVAYEVMKLCEPFLLRAHIFGGSICFSALSRFPLWFRKPGFSKETKKVSAHMVRDKVSPVEISPLHLTWDGFQEDSAQVLLSFRVGRNAGAKGSACPGGSDAARLGQAG